MAGEATHPDLINGSLAGILSELEQDKTFLKLAAGDIEASDDVDNSVLAGIPEGLRPALAAAIGQGVAGKPGKPVVLVVASGREAEETVGSLRSWYDGDPNDIAQLEAWETLPHERLSPRADTVASRMAVFRRLKHPSDTDSMFGPIRILVMPIRSLIQPVVQGLGDVEPLVFTVGEDLPLDEAAKRLIENAYTRVDLVMDRGEFAVRGGIIRESDIPAHLRTRLGASHGTRIDTLVTAMIDYGLRYCEIGMDRSVHDDMMELRQFMFEHVYRSPEVRREETRTRTMLQSLYRYFAEHPDEMPDDYFVLMTKGEPLERVVCDYIASMTDRYSIAVFRRLFIPNSWSKTD